MGSIFSFCEMVEISNTFGNSVNSHIYSQNSKYILSKNKSLSIYFHKIKQPSISLIDQ